MCNVRPNVRPEDKISVEELKQQNGIEQNRRLQWFEYAKRMKNSAWSSKCGTFQENKMD